MPVEIDTHDSLGNSAHGAAMRRSRNSIVVALVNNMPDAALESTEAQFAGLLRAGAAARSVRLRFTSFPELARGAEARARIARSYWPIETVLADPPDALIVTGTEPIAPRLPDEPYWPRLTSLLDWADEHVVASIWSCLAAHAAVEHFDGITRRRLAEKRCGVYAHDLLTGHALLAGVAAPLSMPHSRWNELPIEALRAAGYAVLSFSTETGADAFVRHRRSLMLFFQGHPEYEATTLLKEYRRDVGRYLNGQQAHYPGMPYGYLSAEVATLLGEFRALAVARGAPELLGQFPFAATAASIVNTWRPAAVSIYSNWLDFIETARMGRAEEVSLAGI